MKKRKLVDFVDDEVDLRLLVQIICSAVTNN